MLGKTAGGLYWMFRSLERAENTARLIEAGFRIALTRSTNAEAEWKSVIVTSASQAAYEAKYDGYDSERVVSFLLQDTDNTSIHLACRRFALASPCPNGMAGQRQSHADKHPDRSGEESKAGLARASADLDAFLDGVMVDEDLLPEQVMVLGFSQGTMMALHVVPRREDAVAGIVAFSGRLMEPELLVDEVQSRPPVLLIHGDADDVVPPQSLPQAAEALQGAGWKEVYAHIMKGTGHGIAPDGLSVALAFMRDRLGMG
mgnify:CR=1 FL=1